MFYILDSALKQVQRQKEEEAFLKAVTRQFPAIWNAVSPLLDSERVQRLQRLITSWESRSLLQPLNLTVPPPGHHSSLPTSSTPPAEPTPAPTPASPAVAIKPAPPVVHPAVTPHPPFPAHKPHPPHHGHKPHPMHKPHPVHYPDDDDDDGTEPFAGAGGTGVWNAQYVAAVDPDLEFGDKILLPASALKELTLRSVKFPILLQIRNPANNKRTYVGVREFSAPEGRCMLPRWVLSNVEVTETRRLNIRTIDLPLVRPVYFCDWYLFLGELIDAVHLCKVAATWQRLCSRYGPKGTTRGAAPVFFRPDTAPHASPSWRALVRL